MKSKPTPFRSLYRINKLGSFAFLLSIIGGIISGFINYLVAYFTGLVSSTALQQAATRSFDFNQFGTLIFQFAWTFPLLLLGQMANLTGGLLAENNLKQSVVSYALSHDEHTIKEGHTGDLMARLTSDASVIDDYYFQGLNYRVINPFVSGIAALITVFTLSPLLGFISLGFGFLSYLVSSQFAPKIQDATQKARLYATASTTVISEMLTNEEFIRLANIKDKILQKYSEENNRLKDATVQTETYSHTAFSLNSAISLATQITYLIVCSFLALNSGFPFSNILLLITLQPSVSEAFGNLSASWNYFVEVSVSAARILEVLDTQSEDSRDSKPTLRLSSSIPPAITFDHVSFSYPNKQPLFENISFSVKEHQTVAFVGESGSGKSTLFQLLLGFYAPDSGSIKLNGLSLTDYTLESCRSQMIYIQQEAPLFNRSIYENIALGSHIPYSDISEAQIVAAAKSANIHDFIQSLPDGYNTKVGEDANQISGGQRQRIAIARAFMSNAPILIMDEPTSALDAESETLIHASLNQLRSKKTVLIAAHRLSTIRNADKIIVLKQGMICEEGTHSELLDAKGAYYRYSTLQSESEMIKP